MHDLDDYPDDEGDYAGVGDDDPHDGDEYNVYYMGDRELGHFQDDDPE